MFVNAKIIGLLGILAIVAISAHPILEDFGDVAVPFISYQNLTSSDQEIVHVNKDKINDLVIYNVQNEEGIPEAKPEGEKPGDEKPESGNPGDGEPESRNPGDEKPESGKPEADNPASGKPVAESAKPADVLGKPGANKPGKPMGEGEETPPTTPATTTKPSKQTTTAAPGNSTENNSSSDPIRASTAVFFPMLLVLVKYI